MKNYKVEYWFYYGADCEKDFDYIEVEGTDIDDVIERFNKISKEKRLGAFSTIGVDGVNYNRHDKTIKTQLKIN